jgi:hypothetical protein
VVGEERGEPGERQELAGLVTFGVCHPLEHPATQVAILGQRVGKLELELCDARRVLRLRIDRVGVDAQPAATGAGC